MPIKPKRSVPSPSTGRGTVTNMHDASTVGYTQCMLFDFPDGIYDTGI